MKQLTGLNAFFLHGETNRQAMNLTGLGCYDPSTRTSGKTTFADILHYARERTERSPLFRRRLVSLPLEADRPYWMEGPDFDVLHHVFHVSLPTPGNREQLNQEHARIHARPIDRAHPLWEWWFIDGLNAVDGVPEGSFALAFKLHHAAFDGVSAWEVIDVSHDKHTGLSQDPPRPACDAKRRRGATPPQPGLFQLAMRSYFKALTTPWRMPNAVMESYQILAYAVGREKEHFPLLGGKAPGTPFNRALSGRRYHDRIQISIGETKTVRQKVAGATINDVVLTIISGALRRYLHYHLQLPHEPLVVGVPISIRAKGAEEDAGNEATLALLPLGTQIADPIERLQCILK